MARIVFSDTSHLCKNDADSGDRGGYDGDNYHSNNGYDDNNPMDIPHKHKSHLPKYAPRNLLISPIL